jgi:hypothetical protein
MCPTTNQHVSRKWSLEKNTQNPMGKSPQKPLVETHRFPGKIPQNPPPSHREKREEIKKKGRKKNLKNKKKNYKQHCLTYGAPSTVFFLP